MEEKKQNKVAFVTIGATTTFDDLIRACLQPPVVTALEGAKYTHLRIQYGKDGKALFEGLRKRYKKCSENSNALDFEIEITGFDLNKDGLTGEMKAAKDGVVISHAGSGSILDALRVNAPLIVVPNPSLLDNHQVELAEALAAQGYVVHGQLDNIHEAIKNIEEMRQRPSWPPVNSGIHRRAKGLVGVMDEEMGFLD